jgi:transcriptional regulator with AAA-type ATPase domain
MALFTREQKAFAVAASNVGYCNPFLPERIEYERQALGSDFREADAHWNVRVESEGVPPNVQRLILRTARLVEQCRATLAGGGKPAAGELDLYEDMVLLLLFHRYIPQFDRTLQSVAQEPKRQRIAFYRDFERDIDHFLGPARQPEPRESPAHLFACFFQLRRAFHHIFRYIIGASEPAVQLRAAVWQSIFTHDMRRYRRTLFARMGDIATLVAGPSGTGKELVARAIGLSRYIPFDARSLAFGEEYAESFHPINLSALSPTLIESELFGHRRGAFTGAIQDRAGWLEVCEPLGTVFLDEIAEIDTSIQVKLLRVLESREFQRLGDTQTRLFCGKVIAATNRNMAEEMRAGRFRADLYYRLCSDMIQTPSLHQQIAASPEELGRLILFIVRRIAGEQEAPRIAREVEDWVRTNLGLDYPWPGNVRELEQCVRNVMIRKAYQPPQFARTGETESLAAAIEAGQLTAEQLLQRYCALVYAKTGSLQETARRLGLDRRTVKSKIDAASSPQPRHSAMEDGHAR